MGLIKKYGIDEAMQKTASAMFSLASSSTASANGIVEFAKRLTPMANQAHLTTDQLLALGSASDSMMLMPEVASTAFSKLITALQTNHNLLEKSLDIPKGTISNLFEANHAMDAIVLVLQKLHEKGNMNAINPIFKDMGSDGARLKNVVVAMSGHLDMLQKHLNTASVEFEKGTSAMKEYQIQQETAEGLIERANNLWGKMVVNPESVDVVHDFAKAWYDVSKSLTTNKFIIGEFKYILGSVLGLVKLVIALLPGIIAGLSAAGLTGIIMGVISALKAMKDAIVGITLSWRAMSAAQMATGIGAIVAVVMQAAYWVHEWYKSTHEIKVEQDDLNTILQKANVNTEIATARARSLAEQIKKANVKSDERNSLIRTFNKEFGGYLTNLLQEESSAYAVAKAYEQVNRMLRAKYKLEAQQEWNDKNVKPRVQWEENKLATYGKVARKAGVGYDEIYLKQLVEKGKAQGLTSGSVIDRFNSIVTKLDNRWHETKNGDSGAKDIYSRMKSLRSSNVDPMEDRFTNLKDKSIGNRARVLLAAAQYIEQSYSTDSFIRKGEKIVANDKDVQEYIKMTTPGQQGNGALTNDAEDTAAAKAARKAAAEARARANKHKKWLQDQLTAQEGQVKAFTKAIDAYYTLQEQAIQDLYMDGKITEEEMNRYVALMKQRRDIMAAQGRFAIVGDDNNFDQLRKQMGAGYDQFDYSSESNKLLEIIQKANPSATGKLLRSFESQLGVTAENSKMNEVRNTAVNAQKSESDRRLKLYEASDSYLTSKDYVIKAGREFDDILAQSGLVNIDLMNGSNMAAGKPKPQRTGTQINPVTGETETYIKAEPLTAMRQQFIKEGPRHYDVDTNDVSAMREWLNQFASKNGKGVTSKDSLGNDIIQESNKRDWTDVFPGLDNMLLGIGKEADSQIKTLFANLMKYEDTYYESKKQQLDYETKLLESRWTRSPEYEQYMQQDRDLEVKGAVQAIYGRGDSGAFLNTKEMARNNGFADSIEGDPEIERIRLKMTMAEKEAALARQTSEDKELIRQKERAAQDAELAYAEKVNSAIKERMDLLQQWVDPLQQFSESVGDAFIKMTESAQEGQQALKDATQNMVKTFAKMTIDMMAQQLKMELQRALFHKRMQKSEGDYMEGMKGENEKGHRSIFKALGSFFKRKKKDKEKATKDEKNIEKKDAKEQTDIVTDSQKAQENVTKDAQEGITNVLNKSGQQASEAKTQQATADASTTAAETQGNIFAGIASGAAKIIGKLGWWGIPLIAVIQGLLMGLLNSALSKLFGGGKKSEANTNTKLVSGMLTYDSGNVQAFKGAIDKKTYPVVGDDGNVYAAEPTDQLVTGLLTKPITTMVNGQPSLIAERGPEMIIGRETTQALMMSRPDIISQIVEFDRNRSGMAYRAYDNGNVGQVVGDSTVGATAATNGDMQQLLATLQAIAPAMAAFTKQIQQPINAQIKGYGSGSISEFNTKSQKFLKKYGKA